MAVVTSLSLLALINLSEVLYQYHVSEIEYNHAPRGALLHVLTGKLPN